MINNFTAHEIKIMPDTDEEIIFPSCGYEIRLISKPTKVKHLNGIPVRTRATFIGYEFFKNGQKCSPKDEAKARKVFEKTEILIVSTLAGKFLKRKVKGKTILAPSTEIGDTIRTQDGKILGIKSLQRI